MKYITLVKNEMIDEKKVLVGQLEHFPIAETWADLEAMEDEDNGCNREEVVAIFNSGHRVRKQASLATATSANPFLTAFKKATLDEQEAMLKSGGKL